MRDEECVAFLQWALPRLDLAWPGFRKVRKQVCKRLARRLRCLGLADLEAYRAWLATDPQEWRVLDGLCRITISRFFRDRGCFEVLRDLVLPEIARRATVEHRPARIWSAGCASGEEPYTVRILWDLEVSRAFPDASLSLVATDLDETLIERARIACYPAGALRELPQEFVARAFTARDGYRCLRERHKAGVAFLRQDFRVAAPEGRFDLILCRNLAFTYFAPALQLDALERIDSALAPNGFLVIGAHERLPATAKGSQPVGGNRSVLVRGAMPDAARLTRRLGGGRLGKIAREGKMTQRGVHAFDGALQDANIWLKAIMERLGTEDAHVGMMALRGALHALRDRVGPENAAHLGAQLPTLVRGIYYEAWQPQRTPTKERHKDAFLQLVVRNVPPGLDFNAEAAVRALFDVLWERIDPGEINKLIRMFPHELRELWPAIARIEAEEEEAEKAQRGEA